MRALVEQGGWVLVAIAATSLVAWFLLLGQWLDLQGFLRAVRAWERRPAGPGDAARIRDARPGRTDIVGRLLREGLRGRDPARFFALHPFEEALETESRILVRHLSIAGVLATIAPLLGLLGTILGMMETFRVLSVHGARDVGGFAAGISRALVTTEAGLITALPVLVLHGWLRGKASRCVAEARLCTQRVASAILKGRS